MNVLSMVYGSIDGMSGPSEFFSIEEAGAKEAQVFTALPVMSQGIYTGTVIAAGWDGYDPTLFMVEIGKGPQPEKPDVATDDIPKEEIHISKIPKPLKGQKIKSIDVVIEIDNDYE